MNTQRIRSEDLKPGDSVAFGRTFHRIATIEPYHGRLTDIMFGRAIAEGGNWSISLERGGMVEVAA